LDLGDWPGRHKTQCGGETWGRGKTKQAPGKCKKTIGGGVEAQKAPSEAPFKSNKGTIRSGGRQRKKKNLCRVKARGPHTGEKTT